MRGLMVAGSALALGLLATACGSGGGGGSGTSSAPAAPAGGGAYGSAPTQSPAQSPPAASAAAVDAKKIGLGTIVVDGKGMTLYMFEKDKGGKSSCDGACAAAWPPLLTSGTPTAGAGVKTSLLGTTKRSDGSTQVTYHNWPLYYFVKDKAPGDATGQNVDAFGAEWYVLSAAKGAKLEK
jgi:predicted lipoprotein with Yx(FWY)xxD motif